MKRISFFIFAFCFVSLFSVVAQDDNESMLTTDIEIDGFENFWVQSRVIYEDNIKSSDDFKRARPKGGMSAFLSYVHHYTSKVFSVLASKYPDDMLSKVGSTAVVDIEFSVDEEGEVSLLSIRNGAPYGFDYAITQAMFDDYRKWIPAKVNGQKSETIQHLTIEVTM